MATSSTSKNVAIIVTDATATAILSLKDKGFSDEQIALILGTVKTGVEKAVEVATAPNTRRLILNAILSYIKESGATGISSQTIFEKLLVNFPAIPSLHLGVTYAYRATQPVAVAKGGRNGWNEPIEFLKDGNLIYVVPVAVTDTDADNTDADNTDADNTDADADNTDADVPEVIVTPAKKRGHRK